MRHYPRRYVDRGKLTDIAGLEIGEHATLVAQVESSTLRDMRARRGKLLAVVIRDEKGAQLDCTFFNGHKVQHLIHPGVRAVFSGKVGVFNGKLQLTHPQFEPIDETDEVRPFLSVYPATGKIQSQVIAKCVRIVLDQLDAGGRVEVTDPLPPRIRERESLPELGRALRRIHVPDTDADIHAARHRLVWDEALGVQLALALRRQATAARPAPECPPVAGGLLDAFDARLPFTLTAGQQEVGAQVAADLAHAHPMNRLVQGDVGAGKTIIALRAMLQVVDNGQQAAMLAPTEVLAAQHARSLRAMLGPLAQAGELGAAERATSVTLLTGSLGAKAKRQALLDAQSGHAGIVVGTHALIQDRVGFADLGLVVVDEQHRFGVEQRDALRGRGREGAAHARHDGHADPAHGRDDRLRRPHGVLPARAAPRAVADRHVGRAAGGEAAVVRERLAAHPRRGGQEPPGLRRVPAGGATPRRTPTPTPSRPAPTRRAAARRWPCSTSPPACRRARSRGCAWASCTAGSPPTRRTPSCGPSSAARSTSCWPRP